MEIWPRITTRPLCLRGRTNQKIKQRSRARFCWLNAGCRARGARLYDEACDHTMRRASGATARLRNRQFFSLEDVNAAIRPLLDRLNDKVSRHLGASRKQLFEQLDQPALKPLPVAPYIFAEWKKCRAGIDDHIAIDKHYYSVPYQLVKTELWVRITARTVEVFHIGKRVASHVRTSGNGQHSTHPLPGRRLRHAKGVLSARRNSAEYPSWSSRLFRPFPMIAQQSVCKDQQLPHDRRDGDFFLFPVGDELIVFGFQVRIEPDRDQSRHEDRMSQIWATTLYPRLSLPFPRTL